LRGDSNTDAWRLADLSELGNVEKFVNEAIVRPRLNNEFAAAIKNAFAIIIGLDSNKSSIGASDSDHFLSIGIAAFEGAYAANQTEQVVLLNFFIDFLHALHLDNVGEPFFDIALNRALCFKAKILSRQSGSYSHSLSERSLVVANRTSDHRLISRDSMKATLGSSASNEGLWKLNWLNRRELPTIDGRSLLYWTLNSRDLAEKISNHERWIRAETVRGIILLYEGDLDGAMDCVLACLKKQGVHSISDPAIAEVYQLQGRIWKAVGNGQAAHRDLDYAYELFERVGAHSFAEEAAAYKEERMA
jgi:tetratricopeptide (TPR) repeat protein